METRYKQMFKVLILLAFLSGMNNGARAQYTLKHTFGDLTTCDTMTKGIFVIWYKKGQNINVSLQVMLDTMMSYRKRCLTQYGLLDPPNALAGYYFNIYMPKSGDSIPVEPGNGVGTDDNGYPYLTLNVGAQNQWQNLAHETFHIFQYSNNSKGFDYSDDSQWFIEASANWFSAVCNPTDLKIFVEAESLVKLPQVAMWLSYDNMPDYPNNWQRFVHQYAMSLFLYYLTQRGNVPGTMFTAGFRDSTSDLPQQYLFKHLGGDSLRSIFTDWAAHMTNHFDFLSTAQIKRFEKEWSDYADAWDDKEFVAVLHDSGTGGWATPADSFITHAWAFNTIKLYNHSDTVYQFDLKGNALGDAGDPAYFKGKVIAVNRLTGPRFLDLQMENANSGSLAVNVSADDTILFLNIVSVPEVFTNSDQLYKYHYRITKGRASGIPFLISASPFAASKGQILRDTLLGKRTSFTQGECTVSYDGDSGSLQVLEVNVLNDSVLVTQVLLDQLAANGNYFITVNDSVDGELTLVKPFVVEPSKEIPSLIYLTPSSAKRNDTLTLLLEGEHTHFLFDTADLRIYFQLSGVPSFGVHLKSKYVLNDSTVTLNVAVDPIAPIGIYDLKLIHAFDGTVYLSSAFEVKNSNGLGERMEEGISIYPNPVKDKLILRNLTHNLYGLQITITDLLGRNIYAAIIEESSGENSVFVTQLESGTYFLTFNFNGATIRRKFVKE